MRDLDNSDGGPPAPMQAKQRSHKVVLLGDASVGKSSLVMRFVKGSFTDGMEATVGAAFATRIIEVDGNAVKFDIWDTAGQERFSSLAPMYYRGAAAAVVVYDQTNGPSFQRAKFWVDQLQNSTNPDIVIALAANKMDLPGREVSLEEAKTFADSEGITLIETSAKTGQNVSAVFQAIARRMPETPTTPRASQGMRLGGGDGQGAAGGGSTASTSCSSC
mmetsp:Transcript_31933/g.63267  ORF Transcript_31933/g.63267 Transcript_31933/m.63267 type:complete len:219 (-) Transcript_31933:8-664(-)